MWLRGLAVALGLFATVAGLSGCAGTESRRARDSAADRTQATAPMPGVAGIMVSNCPKTERAPAPDAEQVAAAFWASVPRAYGAFVNQGGTERVNRRNTHIAVITWLGAPGAGRLHREATRVCNEQLATASWAVEANVGAAQTAGLSAVRAFFVPTRNGPTLWRLAFGSW